MCTFITEKVVLCTLFYYVCGIKLEIMSQVGQNVRLEEVLLTNLKLYWKLHHQVRHTGVSFNKFLSDILEQWYLDIGKNKIREAIGQKGEDLVKEGYVPTNMKTK